MLVPVATFYQNLLLLKYQTNQHTADTDVVATIATFMNQLQAGSGGSAGIFTLAQPSMVTQLDTQQPVKDDSWIPNFAAAWVLGVQNAAIRVATVTNVAWVGSGNKDISTPSPGKNAIINIPAAEAILITGLNSVSYKNNPPMALAQAIYNATTALQFQCVGLGAPPILPPVPLVFTAE